MAEKVKSEDEQGPKTTTPMRAGRSPSYPGYDLREAIGKLEKYFSKCKRHSVDLAAAYDGMGYGSANGAAKRALAALRAFGLIESAGNDQMVRISPIGLTIVNLPADDPERMEAIRTAAQKPKIYREMLTEFGTDLPSDMVLNNFLFKRDFNKEAYPLVINPFRATVAFAKLEDGGKVIDEDDDDDDEADERKRAEDAARERKEREQKDREEREGKLTGAAPVVPQGMRSIPVPLGPDKQVIVHYPTNMTKDDLEFFDTIWDLYKTKIVVEPPPPPAPPSVRTGAALWRTKDSDLPVVVTGYYGPQDGRHYARIEGSTSGVPLDELVYDQNE